MPDERKPIEQLIQSARVKGASRIIPDATAPGDVTPEMAAAALTLLREYQQKTSLKWKEIARSAGIESRYISAMLNGKHTPQWQSHAIDLDHWLEDAEKRESATRPTEFVTTQVAEEIYTVAQVASTLMCIGLVFGPSGLGKTLALMALAADKAGSALVSVQTAAASPLGVLLAIGKGLGIRDCYTFSQGRLMARIVELLKGTPRLLIIDEIQKLTGTRDDRALHVLRDLFDATGSPQLWCGSIDMVAYLERRYAGGNEPLAQIRRRIGIARDLTERAGGDGGRGGALFTTDEIRRVFAKSKMRLTPDAIRYLMILANIPDSGALGTCRNLVIMATKVNELSGAECLTEAMLRSVHGLLVSRRDFAALAGRMQEQAATPVHAAAAG
ncbi:MAG TPA: ATP-binding protein [Tepidisphaeraceae bacterium]|jgi:DNA transposition AAA+ family ATPase|nr:ATP-binding protein [Tepidisphaeraceae bacterium]